MVDMNRRLRPLSKIRALWDGDGTLARLVVAITAMLQPMSVPEGDRADRSFDDLRITARQQ
jgi:hypothetical protein